VSTWKSTKAKRVYAALTRTGWTFKKQVGSHKKLEKPGWRNFTFCFHDKEEIGPAALAKSQKTPAFAPKTSNGLAPNPVCDRVGAPTLSRSGSDACLCATAPSQKSREARNVYAVG
jgi:predicted RNA binding protein YcfA (HicA-like mRNA interferase family)